MIFLSEWGRQTDPSASPWLILGKGPSFARLHDLDVSAYRTVSLNHVIREMAVDVAHFIDLDALTACSEFVLRNAQWLLVPRHPHVEFRPSRRPIEEYFRDAPVLAEMSRAGRLVCYHNDLTPWYHADAPPVPDGERPVSVLGFSSEAVVGALAASGVRVVRTLGIDGASSYAGAFADLHDTTRLANGQQNFDVQFVNIHKTVCENAMDYGTLEEPIRVFVGTDDSQMVALKVLEYSIRKYASRPVEVVPLLNLPVPEPREPRNRPRTGFSFARLLIPKLAGYHGRAIYLDADMLVFGDIAELWDLPMNGCRVLCSRQDEPPAQWRNNPHFQPGRQMSVMLLDCARLDWDIETIVRGLDEGKFNYEQLMFDMCIVPSNEIGDTIPCTWNSLEHFEPGRTRLLHFTDMGMQPWRMPNNPLVSVWRAFYREAIEHGAVDRDLVERSVTAGYLMADLRHELSLIPPNSPAKRVTIPTDGVASENYRALQLEAMALRAEVDLLRREAGQCAELRAHCAALTAQCETLNAGLVSLQASMSWRVCRAATQPVRVARNWLRRSA